MDPEMTQKIDAILNESKTRKAVYPWIDCGFINRVRYNEEKQKMYIFTDFQSHITSCNTCRGIAMAIMSSIMKRLKEEFDNEFPDISIEFV